MRSALLSTRPYFCKSSFLLLLLLAVCIDGNAQQEARLENGFKAFSSYQHSDIDSVALLNGNVLVHIPLFSLPQRGFGGAEQYYLRMNNKGWSPQSGNSGGKPQWEYQPDYFNTAGKAARSFGVRLATDYSDVRVERTLKELLNPDGSPLAFVEASYDIVTSDGALHHVLIDSGGPVGNGTTDDYSGFRLLNANTDPQNETGNYTVIDRHGTRYTFTAIGSPPWINFGDTGCIDFRVVGTTYIGYCISNQATYTASVSASSVVDANGNIISRDGTTITDTMGRQIVKSSGAATGCPFGADVIPAPSFGGTATYTLCYGDNTLASSFNVPGVLEGPGRFGGAGSPIIAAILPNGTSWTFTYDNFGNVTTIGYPTGGSVTYTWASVYLPTTPEIPLSRVVATRTVDANDGTSPKVWAYQWSCGTQYDGIAECIHSVTDPDGNRTDHTIQEGSGCEERETKTEFYGLQNGSLTKLKTVNNAYVNTSRILASSSTTWANGQVSKTTYTFAGDLMTGRVDYDYGAGAPGSVLRNIQRRYKFQDDSNYLSNNLLDLLSTETISDGSGTVAAQTTNRYDENSSLQTSGISQGHTSSPANGNYRGNLSSSTRWVGGSDYITTHQTYYDTGMPYQVIDGKGITSVTHEYLATYYGAYPTHMQDAVGHAVTATYDFGTGLMASFTDQNGQTTSYVYDNMRRPTQVVYPYEPLSGGSGEFDAIYNDTPPISVETKSRIDGNLWKTDETMGDGFARQTSSVLTSDTQGADYVSTQYGNQGRIYTVSNPYRSTSDATYGSTSYLYDALDRKTSLTHSPDGSSQSWTYSGNQATFSDEVGNKWQQTTDALGRLTKVLESNGSSATPTMQTEYGYDPLGNLRSVTQWGGPNGSSGAQTRTFSYDGLSRLITASNPENGTICYGVWNGTDCVNGYDANGNLLNKTDARGITASSNYDVLNRITSKSYLNDSSNTPLSCYQYDSSSLASSHANMVGRLTNQWTQAPSGGACPASLPTTGYVTRHSVLAYDVRGHISSEQQCTPQNCATGSTPYSLNYGYDFLGNIRSSDNGIGTLKLITDYDSAGRLNSLEGSKSDGTSSQSLFTANAYGPIGLQDAIYGTSLTTHMDYDSRLRLTDLSAQGYLPSSTPASGTITIQGAEQSTPGYSTGTVTLSGNEQVFAGSLSSGSITISGTEQSNMTQAATASTGTFTISGSSQSFQNCIGDNGMPTKCRTAYDSGEIYLSVNGVTVSYPYSRYSTSDTLAASLAGAITANTAMPVTASSSAGVITLTSKTAGASTNYVLSGSKVSDYLSSYPCIISFAVSYGATMTGGRDSVTKYDAGTISATINGTSASASFGQGSTSSTVASALAAAINTADSGFLTASASNSTITLSGVQKLTNTNWPVTTTVSYDSADFTASSFASTTTAMSGGKTMVYDSGTVTVTVNGTSKSVSYGQSDTSSTIASKLAVAFGSSCNSSSIATGTASGSILNLQSCKYGSAGTYSLSVTKAYNSTNFSSASFDAVASGSMFTGGATGTEIYDQGSVSITIGGVTASSPFSQSSTASAIASDLASKLTGSTLAATASGGTISINTKQTGATTNYTISSNVSYNSAVFGSPSFAIGALGSLTGGTDRSTSAGTVYSYNVNYQPNGNIHTLTDSVMGKWTYDYDTLNRLKMATSTSGIYGGASIGWGYDSYGNRLSQSATGNSSASLVQPTYTSSNNHLDGFNYDAAGNMLADAVGNQFTYDAEGRLSKVQSTGGTLQYVYDAGGHRVAKLNADGSVKASYVLGPSGEQVTEIDGSGNWAHTNVFAGGQLIATYDNDGSNNQRLHFHLSDWLGTRRAQTDNAGVLEQQCSSLPFGDSLSCTSSISTPTEHHFTGKERDTETGLDYFGARYYASNMGRWMSPDWSAKEDPVPYAKLDNPQTLNLYSYVENNPTTSTDPDGHQHILGCSTTECAEKMEPDLRKILQHPAVQAYLTILPFVGTEARVAGEVAEGAGVAGRESVWAMGPASRGLAIEGRLGANLPPGFPTIDKFTNGLATSIKSLDLNASSYQNAATLLSKVDGYIDKVAAFSGGKLSGTTIRAGEITGRELQLAVPGAGTEAQQAALKSAADYASKQGVKLTITQVR